jgi:DNA-binding LytR/AlgR family response regulator
VGEARDAGGGGLIGGHRPDLVFLDGRCPARAASMAKRSVLTCPTWCCDGLRRYAIRAFDVAAVDYAQAVRCGVGGRARRARLAASNGTGLDAADASPTAIAIRWPRARMPDVAFCCLPDEVLFGVEHRLVYAHTTERGFMTNFTLRELEERLDRDTFFRAHKATLVNLSQVKEIVPWFGGRFKLVMRGRDDAEVVVSRAQARELRQRLRW